MHTLPRSIDSMLWRIWTRYGGLRSKLWLAKDVQKCAKHAPVAIPSSSPAMPTLSALSQIYDNVYLPSEMCFFFFGDLHFLGTCSCLHFFPCFMDLLMPCAISVTRSSSSEFRPVLNSITLALTRLSSLCRVHTSSRFSICHMVSQFPSPIRACFTFYAAWYLLAKALILASLTRSCPQFCI